MEEIELGYMSKRSAWGHGYATEAASACLAVARERFGYKRVVSIIDAKNSAAKRVAERLGMTLEFSLMEDSIARVVYAIQLKDLRRELLPESPFE